MRLFGRRSKRKRPSKRSSGVKVKPQPFTPNNTTDKGGYQVTRDELIERLLVLPADIETAEKQVFAASQTVDAAREQVAQIEADAILTGKITGKNETERKAQMAAITAEARQAVAEAEVKLSAARVAYNRLLNEFKALQAVAQLLSKEVA